MSYQLRTTEETRRNKRSALRVIFFIIIVLLFAFATPLRGILSPVAITVSQPFFVAAAFLKDKTLFLLNIIRPESSLVRENKELKDMLEKAKLTLMDYERIKKEKDTLLELQSIHDEGFIAAHVLRVPDSTPYDTILIEGGSDKNIKPGDIVFAYSQIPLGSIEYAYADTSRVKMYSTAGETFDVKIGEEPITAKATGRGGGNFEAILPRGALVKIGDRVILPEVTDRVFSTVEDVRETEGGTFVRVLFKNPVSLGSLQFVSVKKSDSI